MAGRGRLCWGPFAPPAQLPPGYEGTAVVVPTSGSTGAAKAVALTREALLASQEATAQLFAADGTASSTGGHGFWLPLLPPTHIAGVQVIARAHRTAQVLGLEGAALPTIPLPDLRGRFDAEAFVHLAEPALARAEQLGLPALTSLVPTQLARIVAGTGAADVRARSLLKRFAAVLVGGAATAPDVLARAPGAEDRGTHHLRLLGDGGRVRVRPHSPARGAPAGAGSGSHGGGPAGDLLPHTRDRVPHRRGRHRCGPFTDATVFSDVSPFTDISPFTDVSAFTGISPLTDVSAFTEGARRAFLTSDLAQLGEDGALSVLGRADDVINTGGRKVLPQDVERAIERSLMLRGMVRRQRGGGPWRILSGASGSRHW